MATDTEPGPTFEDIDWSEHEPGSLLIARRTVALSLTLLVLLVVFVYDEFIKPSAYALVWSIDPSPVMWLAIFSLVFVGYYGVLPLAMNPRTTRRYWRQLRRRPTAVLALGYCLFFASVGAIGPELLGPPATAPKGISVSARGPPVNLPPFWDSVSVERVTYCVTEVVDGRCQGSIVHPLGTTPRGEDVLAFVVSGMRVALEVTLITGAIIVPIATAVGTLAAYYGGWIDDVLMWYVDFQQVIPAFFVYLIAQFLYGPSFLAMVLIFGLFGWERIARQVRNDAARLVDEDYVTAARSQGARPLGIVRRHIVPNVSSSIASGLAVQIPFIIVMEATLSYIGVASTLFFSWGYSISVGLTEAPEWAWWAYIFPIGFLLVTVIALNRVGDVLYDVIEPRKRGENL